MVLGSHPGNLKPLLVLLFPRSPPLALLRKNWQRLVTASLRNTDSSQMFCMQTVDDKILYMILKLNEICKISKCFNISISGCKHCCKPRYATIEKLHQLISSRAICLKNYTRAKNSSAYVSTNLRNHLEDLFLDFQEQLRQLKGRFVIICLSFVIFHFCFVFWRWFD